MLQKYELDWSGLELVSVAVIVSNNHIYITMRGEF
jgi:hypothetical protein